MYTGSSLVRTADRDLIAAIMADRVAPSTARGYNAKGLPFWLSFLDEDQEWSEERLASDDVFLPPLLFSIEDRAALLSLFAVWLLRTGRDPSVHFPAFAHDLRLRMRIDTAELCKSPAVMVARNFGRRITARDRSKKADENDKLPLSGEMLYSMYDVEWRAALTPSSGGRVPLDITDTAVHVLMAFCMCNWYVRIGNLVQTATDAQLKEARDAYTAVIAPGSAGDQADTDSGDALPAQAALLAEDVWVIPKGSSAWVSVWEYSWMPNPIRISNCNPNSSVGDRVGSSPSPLEDGRTIDAVAVCFRTGKTNQTADRSLKHEVRRGRLSPGKNLFLDMMGRYILFARWGSPHDLFFSRQYSGLVSHRGYNLAAPGDRNAHENRAQSAASAGARYRYNRKGLADLTKVVAGRFGLDPADFSTNSCRKCGISSMQVYLTQKTLARSSVSTRSDHRSDSSTQHYIYTDLKGEESPMDLFNPKTQGSQLFAHNNVVSLATAFRAAPLLGIPAVPSRASKAPMAARAVRPAAKASHRPRVSKQIKK